MLQLGPSKQLLRDLEGVIAALPSLPLRLGRLQGYQIPYPKPLAHTGQLSHWTVGTGSMTCESTLELGLAQGLWWMTLQSDSTAMPLLLRLLRENEAVSFFIVRPFRLRS